MPSDLDDDALRARLYPAPDQDSVWVQPDWDAVIEALNAPRKRRRVRLTRRKLWEEYRAEAEAQDDNRNGRITCKEVRRHGIAPVPRGHAAYPFMRDGDGDGVVCE